MMGFSMNVDAIKDFFRMEISRGRPIPPVEKLDKFYSTFNDADLTNSKRKRKKDRVPLEKSHTSGQAW